MAGLGLKGRPAAVCRRCSVDAGLDDVDFGAADFDVPEFALELPGLLARAGAGRAVRVGAGIIGIGVGGRSGIVVIVIVVVVRIVIGAWLAGWLDAALFAGPELLLAGGGELLELLGGAADC